MSLLGVWKQIENRLERIKTVSSFVSTFVDMTSEWCPYSINDIFYRNRFIFKFTFCLIFLVLLYCLVFLFGRTNTGKCFYWITSSLQISLSLTSDCDISAVKNKFLLKFTCLQKWTDRLWVYWEHMRKLWNCRWLFSQILLKVYETI